VAAGKTLDEARGMAVEALSLHFRGMVEGGEAIPEASTSTLWQTIPPWGVRSHFW
jgi:predicted RNase H-like HicB family nuclease